ncbi:MAG: D-glycero-beta-D-manno-heptose 1-phosphate adenylyltransferase [Candidatus Kapabacteria bacterium]|nr:D-glycero-beta-D-manno-heptose 1-phosphate adenylyltransferase [Candidatus Kapabacteria bacterium]
MICTLDEVLRETASLRNGGKRIVFTNGCFDILHAGHVSYLQTARSFGDALIVGLNNDDSVRRLKGASRPVNTEADRALVLDALRCVDYVVLFSDDTPLHLIQSIVPDVLVKGGDYTVDTIVGAEDVIRHGGQVEVVPLLEGRSTTNTIAAIASGAAQG